VREARRLVDAMSWAVVLPHMLAVLGLLFSEAGVGKAVAHVVTDAVPLDGRFAPAPRFAVGMALLTVVMGNGFAAFPVIAGGIGIPVLVGACPRQSGGDGRDRHVQRLLRHPDDADGRQLQHRAGGLLELPTRTR
jgi:uncharacterized membrane protein